MRFISFPGFSHWGSFAHITSCQTEPIGSKSIFPGNSQHFESSPNNLLVHIYTPGWKKALQLLSVLPKNTTQ